MRKFEKDYRIDEQDDVLVKENAVHADLDLRLDAVEQDRQAFREGNRADVDALVRSIETTFAQLAAEMQQLLDETRDNVSADAIVETATRRFLTDERQAAIVDIVRGGATTAADTLAKLELLVATRATPADIAAAIATLKGSASSLFDTLGEVEAYIQADQTGTAALMTAVGNRVRYDAAQSLTGSEQTQARNNLGAGAMGHALFASATAASARSTLGAAPIDNPNFSTGAAIGGAAIATQSYADGRAVARRDEAVATAAANTEARAAAYADDRVANRATYAYVDNQIGGRATWQYVLDRQGESNSYAESRASAYGAAANSYTNGQIAGCTEYIRTIDAAIYASGGTNAESYSYIMTMAWWNGSDVVTLRRKLQYVKRNGVAYDCGFE